MYSNIKAHVEHDAKKYRDICWSCCKNTSTRFIYDNVAEDVTVFCEVCYKRSGYPRTLSLCNERSIYRYSYLTKEQFLNKYDAISLL